MEAGKEDWSWRVVAGQNAAYDQFPCQFQIFYRGKAKRSMWYDPVFQVCLLSLHYPLRCRFMHNIYRGIAEERLPVCSMLKASMANLYHAILGKHTSATTYSGSALGDL